MTPRPAGLDIVSTVVEGRPSQGHPAWRNDRGFSLLELLVAVTVCALLSGALAGVVVPARAAFDSVPATLDLQQRARTGVEVMVSAIRSAGADVAATTDVGAVAAVMPAVIVMAPAGTDDRAGQFSAVYVVAPVVNASQGVLNRDQPGPQGVLTLGAGFGCPAVGDVCGFIPGAQAAIVDGTGRFDVFVVASTLAGRRELTASAAFSAAYGAGSAVVEVTAHLLHLVDQGDGTRALVRETPGGATQPIVDNVTGFGIEAWGGHPPARFSHTQVGDGPWLPGGPNGLYDADVLAIRRIDFWIRVGPSSDSLRLAAGRSPLYWVPDRTLHASISLRNVR